MIVFIWILFTLMILIGFAGVLLPALPGLLMFFLASLMVYAFIPGVLSGWTVLLMFLGFLASFPVEIFGTMFGAKWGGATKWGILGATIGGTMGIFLGLPGIIIGPILGAFIGEYFVQRRSLRDSASAGAGAGMGLFISTAGKALLAFSLIAALIMDIFFIN